MVTNEPINEPLTWIDGQLVPASAAALPVLDHAVTVGDAVFEAIKLVRGQPFALTRHVQRMGRSAAGLSLEPPPPDLLQDGINGVIEANRALLVNTHDVLRLTWTAGTGQVGSGRVPGAQGRLIAEITFGGPPAPSTSVITVPWARNDQGALVGLKTTSYAENALALTRARAVGATEALFPNTHGSLCEGTGSNVFLVLDGELVTPPLNDGPLAGVTRALVIEWSGVKERSVPMERLWDADEVFITSTGRDVQAVIAADGVQIANGEIGPITRAAAASFAAGQAASMDP
jgi:branched-chain amino acid aminotransferase